MIATLHGVGTASQHKKVIVSMKFQNRHLNRIKPRVELSGIHCDLCLPLEFAWQTTDTKGRSTKQTRDCLGAGSSDSFPMHCVRTTDSLNAASLPPTASVEEIVPGFLPLHSVRPVSYTHLRAHETEADL
eukprot:1573715-Amphidinium_carterae.1